MRDFSQYEEIEIDLPNQTVSSPDKRFHFEIDETWKNKLVNGLDDIAITLQYESLIENMKNHFKGVEYYDSQNNSFYERYR